MKIQSVLLQRFFQFILSILLFQACTSMHHSGKDILNYEMSEIDLGEVKIVANPPYKGFIQKDFELLHMDLSVKPDWKNRYLDGTAILTLTPHAYPQDSLILDAKDFNIISIDRVDEEGDSMYPLHYKYDKRKLNIALINKLPYIENPPDSTQTNLLMDLNKNLPVRGTNVGDTIHVKIIYTAKPEDQYKDSIITKHIEQGLYFINPDGIDSGIPREIWSQGETEHNSDWFPTIDATNQKFTQEIAITVDTPLTTLSNGLLDYTEINGDGTKTDHWSMDQPHSPYLTMIGIGTYTIVHDSWHDSIPVNYYVEPEYAPFAKLIFGHTPDMISYFSKLLDYPYPWPKYSQMVVRDFTSGAMENTTATLLYEPVQHDSHAHLDHTEEETISHELFHHWFGDLVTCKSWAYLCLNESFASFSEAVWEEHKYGSDAAGLIRKQALDGYLTEASYHKTSIVDHYYNDPEDLFDKHRYEKGALVLNMLRHYLGDKVFFKALHNYLVANAYKNTELSDLRRAMEEASGEDLNWFFTQWFEKPGHPVLEISQAYKENEGKLYLYIKQTQRDERIPLFRLKVKIGYWYNTDDSKEPEFVQKDFWLNKIADTIVLKGPKPLNVKFDVGNVLLCQKTELKPIDQWLFQFNAPKELNDFRSRNEALAALSKTNISMAQELWSKALNDSFWYIRRQAIIYIQDLPDSVIKPLLPKIREMALEDKVSRVRSTALNILQDKDGVKALDIYNKALEDSSYLVMATAIRCLFTTNPRADSEEVVKKIEPFEAYTRSQDIMLILANVYGWYGGVDKVWFYGKLKHMGTQYFDFYKRYLSRMSVDIIAGQESHITTLDHNLKSVWDQAAYKNFLNDIAKDLFNRPEGINSESRISLAHRFQDKANSIKINFK